jgi:hypothetical protein
MAEGAGPWIISQMLPRDVLAHETWDQVVPDEDERERLWQGIAWT